MARKRYFCWVRVIPAGIAGSGYRLQDGSEPTFVLELFHGPKRPSRSPVDASTSWFDADEVFYGNPKSDIVFDFGPAFDKPGKAEEWLETTGQQWAKEAKNFFLMQFEHDKT